HWSSRTHRSAASRLRCRSNACEAPGRASTSLARRPIRGDLAAAPPLHGDGMGRLRQDAEFARLEQRVAPGELSERRAPEFTRQHPVGPGPGVMDRTDALPVAGPSLEQATVALKRPVDRL